MTRSSRAVLAKMTRTAHSLPEEKNLRVENKKAHKAPVSAREGLEEDFFEPNQHFRLHSGDTVLARAQRGTDIITIADTADGMTVDIDVDVMNYLTSAGKSRFHDLQGLADAMEKAMFDFDAMHHPSDALTKFLNQWTVGGWKAQRVESAPRKASLKEGDLAGFASAIKSIISLDPPKKVGLVGPANGGLWDSQMPLIGLVKALDNLQDSDLSHTTFTQVNDKSVISVGRTSVSFIGVGQDGLWVSANQGDTNLDMYLGKIISAQYVSQSHQLSIRLTGNKGWVAHLSFPPVDLG